MQLKRIQSEPLLVYSKKGTSFKNRLNVRRLVIGTVVLWGILILFVSRTNSSPLKYLNNKPIPTKAAEPIPTKSVQSVTEHPTEKSSNKSTPIILYWNEYFAKEYKHFVPNEKTKIDCPYECIHTTNRKEYGKTANLRIFHERNFNAEDLPPNNPKAMNVYYTWEPPYLSYSKYKNEHLAPSDYFNVTASYRSSSEIFFPYDYFIKLDGTEKADEYWTDEQIDQKLAKKSKTALIAMSNCKAQSKRHEYVQKLEKLMNVSRVGACKGTIECKKDKGDKARRVDLDCMNELVDEHHFYLAFENSVCPEYVTEKFWRVKELIVPIVLSRSVVPSYIPEGTYIAASDFGSPQELVDHLQYLMKNKAEYKKFFEWAKLYRKTRVKEEEIAVSCQLCKLAHENHPHRIPNYKQYWSSSECIVDYAMDLMKNHNAVLRHERKLSKIMEQTERMRTLNEVLYD